MSLSRIKRAGNRARKALSKLVSREATPAASPQAARTDMALAGAIQITSLEACDEMLASFDAAAAMSDDALRAEFTKYEMLFPWPLPEDPESVEYRDLQFRLYEHLAGKPYAVVSEATPFPKDPVLPFPYTTRSARTVSDQLLGIAWLIRTMNLPAGASILEFGPGWGNTTVELVRIGYDVTAIDIGQDFIDLIRARLAQIGLSANLRQGDFFEAEAMPSGSLDAIVFFECFHHCADHNRLLRALRRAVKPNGAVYFGAEPIVESFPRPWGVRLDGESLRAIRQFGWLELGFKESYFAGALERAGFSYERVSNPVSPLCDVIVARPR